MKKASFIVGLIGGILGILSNIMLLLTGLNMKVIEVDSSKVLALSILGTILSISGLVGACILQKNKALGGFFMLVGGAINIPCCLYSISANNPLTFILCAVVAILFVIAGIIALTSKK